ncbi:MAG: NapC/NirT family cytochrome c [Candidatus Accumulibacter sp.]|jgi:cytochrome c-type protein NapC|nr:NapC/NirT family cytochrome c [Accumulibacter sp.]
MSKLIERPKALFGYLKKLIRSERGYLYVSAGVAAAFIGGIASVVAFNVAMNETDTEEFCISCHEMKDNNYREYQDTIHYANRSGMRATCSDCHVSKEFAPKMIAKIKASMDLYHSVIGTIDTPEKFAARRSELARREWARMKANDSQECRDCHDDSSFDFGLQSYRSVQQHEEGLNTGQTCIDCHKGVAHKLPEIDQGVGVASPASIPEAVFRPQAAK